MQCARCGTELGPGTAFCPMCGQDAPTRPTGSAADGSPLRFAPTSNQPAAPFTSRVESFEGDLVPFLGDPDRARVSGKLAQSAFAVVAVYNLARAGLWAYLSILMGQRGQASAAKQVTAVAHLVDFVSLAFWPTLIAAAAVDLAWRAKRRPKAVLQAHGEAFVEATITRVVPMWLRATSIVLVGVAVGIGAFGSTNPASTSQLSAWAATRGLSALIWAMAWGSLILWVTMSERHLDKRMGKAADPTLAIYSVPYVEPEAENGNIGQPAGAGWLFRTAGLIIAGLFSSLVLIGSVSMLPSGKDTIAALIGLVISGVVLSAVSWAFVRRWKVRGSVSTVRP